MQSKVRLFIFMLAVLVGIVAPSHAQTRIRLEQMDPRVTDRTALEIPLLELPDDVRTVFTLDGNAQPLDGDVIIKSGVDVVPSTYNSLTRQVTTLYAPSAGVPLTATYTYNSGYATNHVIRGNFATRVRTSQMKLLWIGDSITSNHVLDRVTQRAVARWPVNCLGATTTILASGGNWPVILQAQPCGTPILNATNISAANGDNSFNDPSGRFTSGNGFAVGEFVQVSGFTGGGATNNGTWQITSVPSANKIIVTGVSVVTVSAGPAVTMGTCATGFNEATFGLTRAGEGYPPNNSTGITTSRTAAFSMFGDVSNFGSPYQFNVNTTAAYEANWDTGFNARITIIAHTQPDSPAQWNIQAWDRANNNVAGEFLTVNLRQSAANRFFKTPGHARGTGAFNTIARFNSWNEVENNTDRDSIAILNFGVEITNKSEGIFWAYIGDGGWKTRNHMSGVTTENVSDTPAYNGYYTDATLDTYIDAFDLNTYIIWLGQNNASDEWNGITIGNYANNIRNIIARYKASAARVGVSNPRFVLVSTYDTATATGNANARFVRMAEALRTIALADTSVEFVDLRNMSYYRIGDYAAIQGTRMPDTIHPNQTYSNELADLIWSVLNSRPMFKSSMRHTMGETRMAA